MSSDFSGTVRYEVPVDPRVYRSMPKLKPNGTAKCKCGRVISANKDKCLNCNGGVKS